MAVKKLMFIFRFFNLLGQQLRKLKKLFRQSFLTFWPTGSFFNSGHYLERGRQFFLTLAGPARPDSGRTKTTSDGPILAGPRFWGTKTTSDSKILAGIASEGPRSIILRFLKDPKVKKIKFLTLRNNLF